MAQFLPEAAELLAAIARLLDDQVLPVVPPDLQHRVRVAGNLAGILEREARLGPESGERERVLVADLIGQPLEPDDDPAALLDQRLRSDVDDELATRAWAALVEIARGDLAIAKPGHDRYEGV